MSAVSYSVTAARLDDVQEIAPQLRQVDIDEIAATSGNSPLASLTHGLNISDHCKIARADGKPLCMFGIGRPTFMSDEGVIWLLGTDLLVDHSIRFLRQCAEEVDIIAKDYRVIYNHCDARNTVTLKWLKWLGFTIENAVPYGIYGLAFHPFWRVM